MRKLVGAAVIVLAGVGFTVAVLNAPEPKTKTLPDYSAIDIKVPKEVVNEPVSSINWDRIYSSAEPACYNQILDRFPHFTWRYRDGVQMIPWEGERVTDNLYAFAGSNLDAVDDTGMWRQIHYTCYHNTETGKSEMRISLGDILGMAEGREYRAAMARKFN